MKYMCLSQFIKTVWGIKLTEKKKTGKQQFKERMIKQLLTKSLFFNLGILALSAVL